MSKKFDDVLFAAWSAAHDYYCPSSDCATLGEPHNEGTRGGQRAEFDLWREAFSGINEIGVDQDD